MVPAFERASRLPELFDQALMIRRLEPFILAWSSHFDGEGCWGTVAPTRSALIGIVVLGRLDDRRGSLPPLASVLSPILSLIQPEFRKASIGEPKKARF